MFVGKGLSLIEVLFCLLLASILTLAATPALQGLIRQSEAQSAANLMQIRLQQARSLAAQRGRIITVCAGLDQCDQSAHWQGYLLFFEDRDGNGQRSADERIIRQEPLARQLHWRWASFRRKTYLQLQPDGSTHALNGTMTLCQTGTPTYQVVVSLGGRPRLKPAPEQPSLCH